jgi:molybdopterin molybdotransferase
MPLFTRRKAETAEEHRPLAELPPLPQAPPPGPTGLRSLEAHREYLLSCVSELPPFRQHLLDALDLSLCEEVVAEVDLPRFDNSAMDGYAVRAADVADASPDRPVSLPVVGEIAAGSAALHRLSPGTAMKIMTGAPLPEHSDAIVPYENSDRGTSDVRVLAPSAVDQHVRHRGEDIEAGTQLFASGDVLGPRDIGVLAGIGRSTVTVRPRPRVVVISTGTELVEPGEPLERDEQIYDSNSFMLAAAVRAAGAQVFRVGQVGDDGELLLRVVTEQLLRADLILTSGGISQGDYDVVKAVMPQIGVCDFASVAMQPGKPQGFGLIGADRIPMIMLPGNPVSSFVSFEVFVRPVIRKLMGAQPYVRPTVRAEAAHAMTSVWGRQQLARGVVSYTESGRRQVALTGGHGSHLLADLARANALVILPEQAEHVAAGEPLDVWPLEELLG